ncbi:MAG: antitoxin family protein [bacterium]
MGKTIKAKFSKGVLKPIEKVDIQEGKEYMIMIIEIPLRTSEDAFAKAAGSWKGTLDADQLITNIYKDRFLSPRMEPPL